MLNFNWLDGISQLTARIIIICAFFIPLVFVLLLPAKYIYSGTAFHKWKNLKIWVFLLVFIQIFIYLFF